MMDRLVIVSNRVPLPSSGTHAGGLTVALEALISKRGGLWFGWSGRVSSEDQSVTMTKSGMVDYATIDLSQAEYDRYYNNFSNGFLWPLLHSMPELMTFNRRDAQAYRGVNARIMDCLLPLLQPSDIIWIHDYHLMPLAAQMRTRGVRNRIGFFFHVPFCGSDMISLAPCANDLITGVLAADLIGFQTPGDRDNFAAAAQRLAGAVATGPHDLILAGHRTKLGVFPVEIDATEFARIAEKSWRMTQTERLRRSLDSQSLILGVDRLDPSKGIVQRLDGYRRLFQRQPDWRRRTTLLQIAAVSRQDVSSYRELRLAVDSAAGCLNSEIGDPDWLPVRVIARAVDRDIVAGYLRQAKIGLVTPLRDGMNLVAKEFVAAQDPQDPGVLVLSRFAGAARQLDGALLVNPRDPDDIAAALDQGLKMSLCDRQERWHSMWGIIEAATPLQWGQSFVAALMRTERRDARRMETVVLARRAGMNPRATLSGELDLIRLPPDITVDPPRMI
jgi:trehalose 6-phosphate synthase